MKRAPLRNNLFLYDLTIRVLAFWATILFSILFFTGARANADKADDTTHVIQNYSEHNCDIKNDRK